MTTNDTGFLFNTLILRTNKRHVKVKQVFFCALEFSGHLHILSSLLNFDSSLRIRIKHPWEEEITGNMLDKISLFYFYAGLTFFLVVHLLQYVAGCS